MYVIETDIGGQQRLVSRTSWSEAGLAAVVVVLVIAFRSVLNVIAGAFSPWYVVYMAVICLVLGIPALLIRQEVMLGFDAISIETRLGPFRLLGWSYPVRHGLRVEVLPPSTFFSWKSLPRRLGYGDRTLNIAVGDLNRVADWLNEQLP